MKIPALILLICVCVTLLTACGGGSTNQAGSLSGNWQITLQNTDTGAIKSESGFFVQTGNSLSGNILLTGQTVCSGVGSAQGQVSGSNVSISVVHMGETLKLTGTTADGSTTMSGDYSILASPCGNSQVGTWTAVRVPPMTGSLAATFTSGQTAGPVVNLTGKINQGVNNGGSTANLTGSMTTSDPSCLSSVTIGGQISGTAVVLNLLSSEGIALGQYIGTATPDATTITGTYTLFPQGSATNGCNDFGTGTVTVQLGPSS